jgi:metallophosphoesterase superfamily enzyme
MNPKRTVGIATKEVLNNPKTKGLPSKQLARILMRDDPGLFRSVEQARSAVRHYRGAKGVWMLSKTPDKSNFRPKEKPHNPWGGLPPALVEFKWEPVEVLHKRNAVLSDLHLLYYDPMALIPALNDIADYKPECIIVLGDLLDFYEISKFGRDPSVENLRLVLLAGFKFWSMLRRRFPDTALIWKYGNHDERWEKFCWSKAPEFCRQLPQMSDLEWIMNHPSLFSDTDDNAAEGLDITMVKTPVPIKISKLFLLHGHELPKGIASPVNAARGAFLKTAECVMVGHQHQSSNHREISLAGRLVSAWSLPCLCNLHPRYSPINPRWSHGHAFVDRVDESNFHVTQRQIINGKVY